VRILYLADIRFPLERANGIQSMETCHALAARGHQVTLVVRPDSHTPARDPFTFYGLRPLPAADHAGTGFLSIEVVPLAGPAAARRVGYVTFAIGRAMGRTRQDLVFTRDLGLASLLLRMPAAARPPLVYEAHGIAADVAAALPDLVTGAPKASPAKLRRLARREAHVWRAADGYVTITVGLKEELERRFGSRSRIAVVPDGARVPGPSVPQSSVPQSSVPQSSVPQSSVPGREFTLGYAGHLYPWKGVDLVVEAVAALEATRAVIVGGHEEEPDLARVKALAAERGCASRITFTGLIPPADVAARLRDTDVLILPNPASAISTSFTSPLKLFEYMASGRPIVASGLPSLREVLRDGENALLVEPGNAPALTAGIRRIKDDPALGERLARQALADVQQFTWGRRAERLEALFADVVRPPA
jgi:glycosyltransferase involved in cell wall biosynthesis